MSAPVYPIASPVLATPQAAQRLWTIRRLLRERALDGRAAATALRPLLDHPNARVARLAAQTHDQLVAAWLDSARRGAA